MHVDMGKKALSMDLLVQDFVLFVILLLKGKNINLFFQLKEKNFVLTVMMKNET